MALEFGSESECGSVNVNKPLVCRQLLTPFFPPPKKLGLSKFGFVHFTHTPPKFQFIHFILPPTQTLTTKSNAVQHNAGKYSCSVKRKNIFLFCSNYTLRYRNLWGRLLNVHSLFIENAFLLSISMLFIKILQI